MESRLKELTLEFQKMQEETVLDAFNDRLFGRDLLSAPAAATSVFEHKFQELPMLQPITISNETGQIDVLHLPN